MNHIFAICVNQFVMKYMMLIMFYSGLFLSIIHSPIFIFIFYLSFYILNDNILLSLLCLLDRDSDTIYIDRYISIIMIVCLHSYYSLVIYDHGQLYIYLSIFDDRCSIIYILNVEIEMLHHIYIYTSEIKYLE